MSPRLRGCNDCDADVLWVMLAKSGKFVLLDAKPVEPGSFDGKYVLLPNDEGRIATPEDRRLLRQVYTCHWDTCRKRGRQ